MSIFYLRFFSLSDKKKQKSFLTLFLELNEESKISEKIKNNQKNKILVKNYFFLHFSFFLGGKSPAKIVVLSYFLFPKPK
jgi:hypothetical protein